MTEKDHYFNNENLKPFDPFEIKVKARGLEFSIYSSSGIFSVKHIDKGTETLLKYLDLSSIDRGNVCDLGCGYGVVGIVIKKEKPKSHVFFIDSNKRAIKLTKMNLDKEKIKGIAIESNIFSKVKEDFDLIVTNPPYCAGRDTCFNFIAESFNKLNVNGSLQLVCRRKKGGDVLENKMKVIFGNVEILGQKSGFRIYKSIKKNL